MQTAQNIAKALQARKAGSGWAAKCPSHPDRMPSLSIDEGEKGPVVHCHAGCSQEQVIAALRQMGAWPERRNNVVFLRPRQKIKTAPTELTNADLEKIAECQKVWPQCVPIENTPAQFYLQCRGIISQDTPLPPSLRYSPAQDALVAAITRPDGDEIVGLQAIYLERTETGVDKTKKLSFGKPSLGSVKLAEPNLKMQVCESIEDGLALLQMNGVPTLAVPGAGFLARHFVPPKACDAIVLAPDNDDAGRKAIDEAIPRLHELGFTVRVLLPPPEHDWCDVMPEFEERRAIVEEEFYG